MPSRDSLSSMDAISLFCSLRCQRGRPSSILPYGSGFCSNTTTSIPLSRSDAAISEPAQAPPITATEYVFILLSLMIRPSLQWNRWGVVGEEAKCKEGICEDLTHRPGTWMVNGRNSLWGDFREDYRSECRTMWPLLTYSSHDDRGGLYHPCQRGEEKSRR